MTDDVPPAPSTYAAGFGTCRRPFLASLVEDIVITSFAPRGPRMVNHSHAPQLQSSDPIDTMRCPALCIVHMLDARGAVARHSGFLVAARVFLIPMRSSHNSTLHYCWRCRRWFLTTGSFFPSLCLLRRKALRVGRQEGGNTPVGPLQRAATGSTPVWAQTMDHVARVGAIASKPRW